MLIELLASLLVACSERHDNVYLILHRLDYTSCHVLGQTYEDFRSICPIDFIYVDLRLLQYTHIVIVCDLHYTKLG